MENETENVKKPLDYNNYTAYVWASDEEQEAVALKTPYSTDEEKQTRLEKILETIRHEPRPHVSHPELVKEREEFLSKPGPFDPIAFLVGVSFTCSGKPPVPVDTGVRVARYMNEDSEFVIMKMDVDGKPKYMAKQNPKGEFVEIKTPQSPDDIYQVLADFKLPIKVFPKDRALYENRYVKSKLNTNK